MINWDEVKVGETEISKDGHYRMRLLARNGDYFWTKGNTYHTFHIDELSDWTIYDPWEEITNQCQFVKVEDTPASWHLMYGDLYIYHTSTSKKYKISEDGRRVWKRKEG